MIELNKKDLRFFSIAREVSKKSTYKKVHIGAIIVRKNTVIGEGANMIKSHPLQAKYNNLNPNMEGNHTHSIHAEVSAIVHTGTTELDDCVIYIYRDDRTGHIAMCRPCIGCMKLIKAVGIKTIYYTTNEGFCEEHLA